MFTFRDRIIQIIEKQYDGKQARFCKAVNIPTSIVNKVVNREQDFLNGKYLANIHANIGISLDWLLTGEGSINGGQTTSPEGVQSVASGPIGDVRKIEKRELLDQTLHDYLDLILVKGVNTERRDQIIRDIWNFGEELSTVSEKESVIKQVLKKIMTG